MTTDDLTGVDLAGEFDVGVLLDLEGYFDVLEEADEEYGGT